MRFLGPAVRYRVMPAQQRDARQQEGDAESRPHERVGRRPIADQRFARPVVCIGDGAARSLGNGCPCGPPEERCERPPVRRVRRGVVLHRVGFTQVGGGRIVAEQALVMRRNGGNRRRAVGIQPDRAGGRIVAVLPHARAQPSLEGGPPFFRQLCV